MKEGTSLLILDIKRRRDYYEQLHVYGTFSRMSFANLFVIPHRPSRVQVFDLHGVLERVGEWHAQVRIFEKII